eukprot:TRINITY_DN1548_c0_g1_i6.p1 TRINITY_DN1548_c0_g1~~TRINITY_DN1548_c0_g1_i6.p1  ORF type:complete len:376 (-),score=88.40 TRINITY_DN1548_c0_g1_i6:90-1217(-)
MKFLNLILFVTTLGFIGWWSYDNTGELRDNFKRGLIGAGVVATAYGMVRSGNGQIFGRFSWFWRGTSKFCFLYLLFLTWVVFHTSKDARHLMSYIDPNLGKPVTKGMHTYDDNCELLWENVADNIDHYFWIHAINWFAAALIVRDVVFLNFWSVLDEFIELSWQHMLPHFRECWWDHVFLDVLVTNTPAIFIGVFLINKLFGLRKYDWFGRENAKSILHWDLWHNHKRLQNVLFAFFIICVNFLTGFLLINSLWIPPKNYFNIYRLVVWFILANLAFVEGYHDLDTYGTPANKEISSEYRWLTSAILALEVFISWKFRHDTGNLTEVPWPSYVTIPWAIVVGLLFLRWAYLRVFKPIPPLSPLKNGNKASIKKTQ